MLSQSRWDHTGLVVETVSSARPPLSLVPAGRRSNFIYTQKQWLQLWSSVSAPPAQLYKPQAGASDCPDLSLVGSEAWNWLVHDVCVFSPGRQTAPDLSSILYSLDWEDWVTGWTTLGTAAGCSVGFEPAARATSDWAGRSSLQRPVKRCRNEPVLLTVYWHSRPVRPSFHVWHR